MTGELERLRALSEAATKGPYAFNGYPFTLADADAEFAVAASNYVRDLLARDVRAGLLDEPKREDARWPPGRS